MKGDGEGKMNAMEKQCVVHVCSRPAIVGSSQRVTLFSRNSFSTSKTAPPVYTHPACSRHGETIFHREHPLCAASDSCGKHRDPSGEKRILETHLYITTAFFLTQDATVHQRSQRPANRGRPFAQSADHPHRLQIGSAFHNNQNQGFLLDRRQAV